MPITRRQVLQVAHGLSKGGQKPTVAAVGEVPSLDGDSRTRKGGAQPNDGDAGRAPFTARLALRVQASEFRTS